MFVPQKFKSQSFNNETISLCVIFIIKYSHLHRDEEIALNGISINKLLFLYMICFFLHSFSVLIRGVN